MQKHSLYTNFVFFPDSQIRRKNIRFSSYLPINMLPLIFSYVAMFCSMFKVSELFASQPHVTRHITTTSPKVVAQYMQGIIHVLTVMCCRLMMAYFPEHEDIIYTNCRAFCVSFFIFDALFIIIYDLSQWQYIPHHVVSILIGYYAPYFISDPQSLTNYMFYIELSNVFLAVWDLSRKNKATLRHVYDTLTPFFAITYVPIRMFYTPIVTYVLFKSLTAYSGLVSVGLVFIMSMSFYFSIKVARIMYNNTLRYKITSTSCPTFTDRLYTLLKTPDFRWWPVITYIGKWFIMIHYIVHIIPKSTNRLPLLVVAFADFTHMVISFTYYVYDCAPLFEKLDFLSVSYKIVINSMMYFLTHRHHTPSLIWDLMTLINMCIMIVSSYDMFIQHKNPQLHQRGKVTSMYAPVFLLGVTPILIHNSLHEVSWTMNASALAYVLGCWLWMVRFPEAIIKTKYLNSLGWMHVMIIIGDALLMNNLT